MIVSNFSTVYIIIDALDECSHIDETRNTLLKIFGIYTPMYDFCVPLVFSVTSSASSKIFLDWRSVPAALIFGDIYRSALKEKHG